MWLSGAVNSSLVISVGPSEVPVWEHRVGAPDCILHCNRRVACWLLFCGGTGRSVLVVYCWSCMRRSFLPQSQKARVCLVGYCW